MTGKDIFEQKAFAGLPIDNCTVIDAHGHLGRDPEFAIADTSLESIVASMDRIGIDIFCVSAFAGIYGQADHGIHPILDALNCYPDRFFGYITVDIGYPKKVTKQLEDSLNQGLRAIKIYSSAGHPCLPYDHPNYDSVFDFARANSLPILAHTWGAPELTKLEPQFKKSPNVNFLMAHTACQDKEKYIQIAKDYENVYLETCLSECPRGLIEELVGIGLVDKIIWGSDAIFMSNTQQIGKILFAQISPDDKVKILGTSAQRVLNL